MPRRISAAPIVRFSSVGLYDTIRVTWVHEDTTRSVEGRVHKREHDYGTTRLLTFSDQLLVAQHASGHMSPPGARIQMIVRNEQMTQLDGLEI